MKILIQWHAAFRWFLLVALTGYVPSAWTAEAVDATAVKPSIQGDFENLRTQLETRGWRIERSPDGSILLIPLRDTPPATASSPALITVTASPEDAEQLRELLKAYGWTLVDESGDTVHLLPPAHPGALSTAPTPACADGQPAALFTSGVTLPVSNTREAWQISANWLWQSGYTGLGVGTIRDINWIYLVKIVDRIPPYRPRNELIINKRNGRLLALY